MTRQNYQNSMIYHTNQEEKDKFQKEIYKRWPTMAKFAKDVINNPEVVFNSKP